MNNNIVVISEDNLRNLIKEEIETALSRINSKKVSKKLMTAEETCKYLRIHPSTLFRWKKEGKILPQRMGKRIYFNEEDIKKEMKKNDPERFKRLKAYETAKSKI